MSRHASWVYSGINSSGVAGVGSTIAANPTLGTIFLSSVIGYLMVQYNFN